MKPTKISVVIIIGAILVLIPMSVFAQRFKINETHTRYDRELLYTFMNNPETQDDNRRAEFFLNLPETKLKKTIQSAGGAPEVTHVVTYVDSKTGDFRSDTKSPDGHESMFYRKGAQNLCTVNWTLQEYFCFSPEKMNALRQDAQRQLRQQMPDLEQMLAGLPEDARKKALDALKQSQSGGAQPYGSQGMSTDSYRITKTGKKRNENGDSQEQIRFTSGNENGIGWISKRYKNLLIIAQFFAADMNKRFGNMADNDLRTQNMDGYLMEVRTFEQNMMRGQAQLDIEKVTEISKGFSGNPFHFDKSKLTEKSPMR